MILYGGKPLTESDGVTPLEGTDRVHTDHDLWFTSKSPNTSPRPAGVDPSCIVFHWTGGERPPPKVFQVLEKRRLSIHFIIDIDGTIWQHADLALSTAHVGSRRDRPISLNKRSIGIELVSRGFANKEDLRGLGLRERSQLDWMAPRDVYRSVINGRKVNTVSYYYPQHIAALWLAETLCGTLNIPRRVPEIASKITPDWLTDLGVTAYENEEGKRVLPAFDREPAHTRGRRIDFEGVLGHFHVHKTKYDPGAQLFASLWQEGFNPPGIKTPFDQIDPSYVAH